MNDACCPLAPDDVACDPARAAHASRATCPTCTQPGRVVAIETLKAQLACSLRVLTALDYRFCPTPDCPVVYFSHEGAQRFMTDQIRVPVYQKRPTDAAVLICYCFGYTAGELRCGDAAAHAAILADVTSGTQQGQCACEIRNPQGSCCLGNLRALVGRTNRARA